MESGNPSGGTREEDAAKIKRLEEMVEAQHKQIQELMNTIRAQSSSPQAPSATPVVISDPTVYRTEAITTTSYGVTQTPSPSTVAVEDPALRMARLRKEFMRCRPQSFAGGADLQKADTWIRNMEKIHRTMQIDELSKVILSAFMLEGDADIWWQSVLNVQKEVNTWQQFKELFNEQYYPKAARDMKRQEFLKLEQGDMTVREYEVQFTYLSQFAGSWMQEESEKITKFILGLKP